jgi:disulfide bond formation protein DsbB
MNPLPVSPRLLYLAPALACAGLLGFGFYLQYFDNQNPCPLCYVQRGFYFGVIFAFVPAALHNPGALGRRIYCAFGALMALGGFGTAARQVWLQHLPLDQVPACGPDLFFMVENFPLTRMLQNLFKGSGQCAEVTWRFLGLSIAEWSFACFAGLAAYAVWLGLRKR